MRLYGALEHMRSSLYTVPSSMTIDDFRNMSSHEFFHIVTPLNIRSTIIDHFSFATPVPSLHLWLYEGLTEYASHHLQVKAGLITPDAFCALIGNKFLAAQKFRNDLPFTELSLGCYDKHAAQYGNVYQKGALLAMALDLELLRLSKGKMTLRELLQRLIKRFGPDKPFVEEEFFTVIAECSQAEIKEFLERHMAGAEAPPYAELLAQVGIEYTEGTHRVSLMANASPAQLKLRKRWLTYEAEGK
jgi:predicted metalloprotease with PDZ domain